MTKIKKMAVVGASYLFFPALALAQGPVTNWTSLYDFLLRVGNQLTVLLVAAAVVYFLYSVLRFAGSGGDEAKRKGFKENMIYGIIAIAIMLSVWGLVAILTGTFNFTNVPPQVPRLPTGI